MCKGKSRFKRLVLFVSVFQCRFYFIGKTFPKAEKEDFFEDFELPFIINLAELRNELSVQINFPLKEEVQSRVQWLVLVIR